MNPLSLHAAPEIAPSSQLLSRGDSRLIRAAYPLFVAIAEVRYLGTTNTGEALREELIGRIRQFELHAQQVGLPYETVLRARYCLCTALDEAAAQTTWANSTIWSGQGLLVTFHNETWGGEKFFQLLATLSQHPKTHIQLLELMNYCLLLGFEGRYRVMETGLTQLDTVKQRLMLLIHDERGGYSPSLSFAPAGCSGRRHSQRSPYPWWASAAVVALLSALLFIMLNGRLAEITSPVVDSIYQTSLPTLHLLSPPSAGDVNAFLRKEIDQGLLTVNESTHKKVVMIKGDGLFDSGTETIRARYVPIIGRVAQAMNALPGEIIVTGYSDNVPVRAPRFTSNQALSLARAKEVSELMQKHLFDPRRVKARGLAEKDPIAPNDSKANQALNRRVDITLVTTAENSEAITADGLNRREE